MVKKRILAACALLLATVLALTGCSGDKAPKDELQAAVDKTADIRTYRMEGSLSMQDAKLPAGGAALGLMNNATITWTGAYRADPMLAELTLSIPLGQNVPGSLQIPLLMNDKKLWIQVPSFALLGIPQDIAGKYLEVDLQELAKKEAKQWPGSTGDAAHLARDVYGIVAKHVDEKAYLSVKTPKEAGLEDKDLKSVVQLQVTNDQSAAFLQTLVRDIAPEVVDLLAGNEQYRQLLGLTPEELEKAKKRLAEAKTPEAGQSVDVLLNEGIDDKGYASYTGLTLKGSGEGSAFSGTIKGELRLSDINGDVKFQQSEPKSDQILTEEQAGRLGDLIGGLLRVFANGQT